MTSALLDGMNHVGTILAKALPVKRFDEGRERQLPGLLVGVIELAEFPGVHAQFPSHLHMGVREVVAFACRNPFLQVLADARGLRAHA